MYLKFTEDNDWEGEVYHSYFLIEGNEASLEALKRFVARGSHDQLFPYSIQREPVDPGVVESLVELSRHEDDQEIPKHASYESLPDITSMNDGQIDILFNKRGFDPAAGEDLDIYLDEFYLHYGEDEYEGWGEDDEA